MTAESRVVEAANPRRARAKDGAGFGRAGFTARFLFLDVGLALNGREATRRSRAGRGCRGEWAGDCEPCAVRSERVPLYRLRISRICRRALRARNEGGAAPLGTGRDAGRCGKIELCRQTMIRIGWPSLAVAAVLLLGIANGASGQGLAVNPSAAASDIRNPSSTNPAAAASDVRNPSAFNPAAAASDIRQPSVASPSSPAAMAPRVRRTRVVLPERRSRASQRSRRAPAAATQAATRERRAAEARPRPATTAERKASAIMGSVCRGC